MAKKVEDLEVQLNNLTRKVGNMLNGLGSFWAQGFFPLTCWGVARLYGRQACGQTNRPVA